MPVGHVVTYVDSRLGKHRMFFESPEISFSADGQTQKQLILGYFSYLKTILVWVN